MTRKWAMAAGIALAAVLVQAGTASSDTGEGAAIMPLAPQALLLDITTAGERLVAVGSYGIILHSLDGSHWQQASVPTDQMLTAVYFVNENRGWAVGHDGLIVVSDDGGATWRLQRDGLVVQHQANLEQREHAYDRVTELSQQLPGAEPAEAARLKRELELARSDLEEAEQVLQESLFTAPLLDVWFSDRKNGWAVGAFGSLLRTADGGQHWRDAAQLLDNPDEFHLNAITGDGKGRLFIAGEGGVMFRSLDSGQSWEALSHLYDGSWFGAIFDPAHDSLLVFGLQGTMLRSGDFGDHWQSVEGAARASLAGGEASAGTIAVAGSVGTILLSVDGGASFRTLTLPDRLNLSSALVRDHIVFAVGQGGVRKLTGEF